jgi:hypothetical protein
MTALALPRPAVVIRWVRPLAVGLTLLGLAAAVTAALGRSADGFAWDARAYYLADYSIGRDTQDFAYLYSPAFAQVLAPLRSLQWEVFLPVWAVIQAVAFVALAGPFALPLLLFPPVIAEIDVANVTFLIGIAIVAGFRYPAAWSLVLLTKVTPGVGLLWFAFRREWRPLGIALGATAAIVAVSFVLAPGLWFEWVQVLTVHEPTPGYSVPFAVRLPIATVLLWAGARTDRYWVVPIAAMLCLPVLRLTGLALLVACVPLISQRWTAGIASARPREESPDS